MNSKTNCTVTCTPYTSQLPGSAIDNLLPLVPLPSGSLEFLSYYFRWSVPPLLVSFECQIKVFGGPYLLYLV